MLFYLIVDEDKKYHQTELKYGLNVHPETSHYFKNDNHYQCSNLNEISDFYNLGTILVEFETTNKDQNDNNLCKTIIVHEFYSLFDVKTYNKFGLNISDNKYLANYASKHCRIDVLEILKFVHTIIPCDFNSMDWASEHGHTSVLNWWLNYFKNHKYNNTLDIKKIYSYESLDLASKNNHIEVLDWWLNSKLVCKYDKALQYASKNKNLLVLDWWKNSGLYLNIHSNILDNASRNNHEDVLIWWLNYYKENPNQYNEINSHFPLLHASGNGFTNILNIWKNSGLKLYNPYDVMDCSKDVKTLEWWKRSGLQLNYSHTAIDCYSTVEKLQWWFDSGLVLKYTTYAINYASTTGEIPILEWWKKSGLDLLYDSDSIYYACINGHINVLEWWKNSGLTMKYTKNILYVVSNHGHLDMLIWWKNSGLDLKLKTQFSDNSINVIENAIKKNRLDIVQWWKSSGLPYYHPKSIVIDFDKFMELV
ncbi:putative ankyrin repeat protein [Cotonvirus japonicus]|uniref:Ankyrin repeat protein n=1 Tax=Cotonvirus japonicus TaxID=2811091 RepID=A0ABM7NRL3_9VIRU|nr:putative ankyrin repeat protein [Cotonvirus japonicus]BCS82736.1 putative ankyrin repeat protein [Cotonvirus japonicus]